MDGTTDLTRQIVKEPKKDLSRQRKLDRMNMLNKRILSRPKKLCGDLIQEESQGAGRDRLLHVVTEACNKDLNSVVTTLLGPDKECNLAKNFGDPQCSLEFKA